MGMKDNSERVVHFEVVVESILFADLRIVQRQKEKRKKKIKQNKKKKKWRIVYKFLVFPGHSGVRLCVLPNQRGSAKHPFQARYAQKPDHRTIRKAGYLDGKTGVVVKYQ